MHEQINFYYSMNVWLRAKRLSRSRAAALPRLVLRHLLLGYNLSRFAQKLQLRCEKQKQLYKNQLGLKNEESRNRFLF